MACNTGSSLLGTCFHVRTLQTSNYNNRKRIFLQSHASFPRRSGDGWKTTGRAPRNKASPSDPPIGFFKPERIGRARLSSILRRIAALSRIPCRTVFCLRSGPSISAESPSLLFYYYIHRAISCQSSPFQISQRFYVKFTVHLSAASSCKSAFFRKKRFQFLRSRRPRHFIPRALLFRRKDPLSSPIRHIQIKNK